MAEMNEHDRVRMMRGIAALQSNDKEVLEHALLGLQSTDAPELVPLHDNLMERYNRLYPQKKQKSLM